MARWLVTGATGFVGSHLIAKLAERGHETWAFVRPNRGGARRTLHASARLVSGDVTDVTSVSSAISHVRPDVVAHLAAYGTMPGQVDSCRMINVNCVGSFNVIDACRQGGVRCVIVAGSSSEYGRRLVPMKEDQVMEPYTLYGISKCFGSSLVGSYGRDHGLNCCTLRLFSPYGPGDSDSRLIPTLLRAVLDGQSPLLNSPSASRDFVYIEDVVEAFLVAAQHQRLNGRAFNIGSGKSYTVLDVVRAVSEVTGRPISPVWGASEAREHESPVWVADSTLAEEVLGFRARVSLPEGLSRILDTGDGCEHA